MNDPHIISDHIASSDAPQTETITITLPIWMWIAIGQVAERHHVSIDDIAQSFMLDRIDALRSGTEIDDNGHIATAATCVNSDD